jgi:hypothetical protein
MKIGTAFAFVCVGVYIAYNYPEVGEVLYAYIKLAIHWVVATYHQISAGG